MKAISFSGLAFRLPLGQRLNVALVDVMVVFLTEQVFEQNLQRNREPGNILEACLF
jgi:hypothetical protein